MAFLTKAQIFAAPDVQREVVTVPEWGGDVLVQGLSGTARDAFEATVVLQKGKDTKVNLINIRAKLVALSIVDEAGATLFDETDVARLGQRSALALQRVFDVAQRLSGLTPSDVDELTKNLMGGRNGDSGSVSP